MNFIPVIGEITAETFRNYVEMVEIGGVPKKVKNLGLDYVGIWWPDIAGAETLPVLISSPGGDVGYTLAMLDDIDFWKRTTFATGICQSAAAVLATAGEGHRICTMDTLFRFIKPAAVKMEVGNDVVEKIPDLDYFLHSIRVARLAQRLKVETVEVEDLFDGKFISSVRAKELGLIDEIISTSEVRNGNIVRLRGREAEIDDSSSGILREYRIGSDDSY